MFPLLVIEPLSRVSGKDDGKLKCVTFKKSHQAQSLNS